MAKGIKSQEEMSATEILRAEVINTNKDLTQLAPLCNISYSRFYRIIKQNVEPTFDEAVRIYDAISKSVVVSS